jgi:hypothetical protein
MSGPAQEDGVEMVRHKGYWEARYLGAYAFARYKKQMEISVRACEEQDGVLLLVDIRSLQDFKPSTQERYEFGKYGAEISKKLERVSVVGEAVQLDPEQFATMVARNRGLKVRAFTDRNAAVEWLLNG